MRRLSNTFLTVGMILAIILGVTFLSAAIVLFIMASPVCENVLRKIIEEIPDKGDKTIETIILVVQGLLIGWGVGCIFVGGFAIPSAIVASKAKKNPTDGLLIANIVLGCFGSSFNIAGGILGLIYNARVRRNERRAAKAANNQ